MNLWALPVPEIWAEARARETGRDMARAAAAARELAGALPLLVLAGPDDGGDGDFDDPDLDTPDLDTPDLDTPAFILATSGSSGVPKLVVHSQRGMAYRARIYAAGLRAGEHVLTASGPPGTYSGMQYLFSTVVDAVALLAGLEGE